MTSLGKTQIALSVAIKTMSSREIAEVVDSRHDHVKRSIERLSSPQLNDDGSVKKEAVIQLPPLEEVKNHLGQTVQEYRVNERDSYIVVAQLCPEYTANLVDYWMATKNQQPVLALPSNYKEALLALIQAEDDKEALTIERDNAIATKAQIGSKREAQAMNKASQATKEANKLKAELGRCTNNATIIAVKNITGIEYKWQPLRKWCKAMGVKAIEVVDARFGVVKSWPSVAWESVYGIDLSVLFASEAA